MIAGAVWPGSDNADGCVTQPNPLLIEMPPETRRHPCCAQRLSDKLNGWYFVNCICVSRRAALSAPVYGGSPLIAKI